MSGLFAYWKEISIVLSGVFAILGLLWETKDKATGKITYWGRAFLALTIVSMAGGFVAQAIDDSAERERSKIAQEDMFNLLKRTEQTVSDTNRLMQPLGHPSLSLFLKINCQFTALQKFCADVSAKGNTKERPAGALIIMDGLADWSLFPFGSFFGRRLFVSADFIFLEADVTKVLNCADCAETGDMSIPLREEPREGFGPGLHVFLKNGSDDVVLFLDVEASQPIMRLKGERLLVSFPDLAVSTLLLSETLTNFEGFRPDNLLLMTERGQRLQFTKFDLQIAQSGKRFFVTKPERP